MNGGRFQFSTFKIARGRFETEPLTKPTTKIVLDSVCRHINQRAIGKRFFQVVRCSQIGQVCFRFSNGRLGIILHRNLTGEIVSAAADKGSYQGETQYAVTSTYIPDQVEPEEEEVKPNEWLMPQLSRFIAKRSRKPTNSDTKTTDQSE